MERLIGIGDAAQALGVSITTLRRWEATGKLSAIHTAGGHRRYDLAKLKPEMFHAACNLKNMAVSSTVSACGEESTGLGRKTQVKLASMKQEVSSKSV